MPDQQNPITVHTPMQSVAWHLLPGLAILAVYIVLAPLVKQWGYPPQFALSLAVLGGLLPVQLGLMLRQGSRAEGHLSLRGAVLFREPLPIRRYASLVVTLLVWNVVIFAAVGTWVDGALQTALFGWLPDWIKPVYDLAAFDPTKRIITWVAELLLASIAAPAVEELYFRGFLLPRMPWKGNAAVVAIALLFSLYHFWSPWQIVTRILAVLPLVYIVQRERNVYVGVLAHVLLNTILTLASLPVILAIGVRA